MGKKKKMGKLHQELSGIINIQECKDLTDCNVKRQHVNTTRSNTELKTMPKAKLPTRLIIRNQTKRWKTDWMGDWLQVV
jgi:hypothetical protein